MKGKYIGIIPTYLSYCKAINNLINIFLMLMILQAFGHLFGSDELNVDKFRLIR